MILKSEIYPIGRTLKPHGINGEIAASVESDIDLASLKCIVLDIDGIYVPFFIDSFRSRGSESVLLMIDGIKDENQAAGLCNKDIYALRSDIGDIDSELIDEDGGFYMSDLIGFTLYDQNETEIGSITNYDDSTANCLLVVEDTDNNTRYIPIADELIEGIDPENKTISINIPEGLLDL
ncbi:MAG: ribosome maturation factor RimM [Muribaculaceae bacterium]|nr:ribosome maturation factor RimM [Muribaculaceae bacterium]